jgi:uncharacterized protein (UPF0333 family)
VKEKHMIKMDKRGQLSIEFVLVIAFMLILVLAFATYIGDANEKNSIASAARTGATNSASSLLVTNTITQPLQVEDVNLNANGANITIVIDISGPLSTTTNSTITNQTLQSIANAGYTLNNANVTDPFIVTSRHVYRVLLI